MSDAPDACLSEEKPIGRKSCGVGDLVLAPGYQACLFLGAPTATVRWRTVRRDGTRFPLVAELGVIIAQTKALLRADGTAWVVGSDGHTVEINAQPNASAGSRIEVIGIGPRWSRTLAEALHH